MKTIGKCTIYQDPIYDFQTDSHRGCLAQDRQGGLKMTNTKPKPIDYKELYNDLFIFLNEVHCHDVKVPHKEYLALIIAKQLFKLGYKKEG